MKHEIVKEKLEGPNVQVLCKTCNVRLIFLAGDHSFTVIRKLTQFYKEHPEK